MDQEKKERLIGQVIESEAGGALLELIENRYSHRLRELVYARDHQYARIQGSVQELEWLIKRLSKCRAVAGYMAKKHQADTR